MKVKSKSDLKRKGYIYRKREEGIYRKENEKRLTFRKKVNFDKDLNGLAPKKSEKSGDFLIPSFGCIPKPILNN